MARILKRALARLRHPIQWLAADRPPRGFADLRFSLWRRPGRGDRDELLPPPPS